ncbi:FecR family protein [Sphingobium sp. Cam5-1]|uniref:FecR family protein n=1 Tax=Sphingobium sp. Cam5-1 TaxID=2789327 RepID=UPI0018AD1D8D|nr:FecR domain-containing protein [Sphingobium sp. Cam5-1]QPI72246.1 FecR domain-containing protein [Sphingobium sp. Cam5-1]
MTEAPGPIPRRIHDTAGDWLVRRQQHPGPEVEQAFAAWIAADRRHRIAYEQIELHWADSGGLTGSEVGRTRKLVRAPFLMRHSTHVAAASLGVVVLLGIGTVGLVRYGAPFTLVAPAQAATYETALGEIRTVSLADGSQLTLDTATRVHVSLSAGERRVSLERGRARFRVAQDSKRPFTVEVPGGTVAARSTLFDVSVVSGSPVIAVLEGRVDLTSTGSAASRPGRTLAAGQTVALDNAEIPHPTPVGETQWVSGMLALDGSPLGEAVAAINRYNRIQIRLAEPDLARFSVTGAFQVRDPDAFAQAVAATFGLSIDRSDPGVILLRPGS